MFDFIIEIELSSTASNHRLLFVFQTLFREHLQFCIVVDETTKRLVWLTLHTK